MTPPDDAALRHLAARTGQALVTAGWQVALAESCTGGWLAKALTDIAGSSQFFTAGFVTYANEAKQSLGVEPATLAAFGAVSREVVLEMAAAAKLRASAALALAVSGVAGPTGGTADKPVGLVWFALAGPATTLHAESQRFAGDRDAVRRRAVAHGLTLIAAAAESATSR